MPIEHKVSHGIRKGMPPTELSMEEFRSRFLVPFSDPAFDTLSEQAERLMETAWEGYIQSRKVPRTRRAGNEFSDPDYQLSVDWLETRAAIQAANARHTDRNHPLSILLINGSPRSEHTCPGEMSKTYRLIDSARTVIAAESKVNCEVLDLSRICSEYGLNIHPCKACFSTAPALCHWPCSCYPNHALGQVNDWMHEIYPMWVAAHGIMIITPVHWYQAPTVLKAMLDRLVCADGGNSDPTSTRGKDPRRAKALELAGWPYPRYLAGRAFSIVVHGDTAGAENLRRMLTDSLTDMHLVPAGKVALLDRYVGYYKPYATSHNDLDADAALFEEVRNAARTLVEAIAISRAATTQSAAALEDPRPK